MSSFFVTEGADRGHRFELDSTRTDTIGREDGNTIVLHDTEVSRKHAQITWENGRFVLTDLNSSNGTYVNGRKVLKMVLSGGDQLRIGSSRLQFTQTVEKNTASEESYNSWVSFELPSSDRSQIVQSMRRQDGNMFSDKDCQSFLSSSLNETEQAETYLRLVCETATALKSTVNIDQLLEKILDLIFQWINPDRGCVLLTDPQTQILQPRCFRIRQKGVNEKLAISQTILDFVMTKKEGVLTSNAMDDSRFDAAASILRQKVNEAICVPLDGRYGVVGVIYIDTAASDITEKEDSKLPASSKEAHQTLHFDENHLKMMIAIAHHAAIAIEDTRFYSAMIQSERLAAIGQTVANLSHHIKNILQGVSGGSYLIESGLKSHDETLIGKGWKIVDRNQGKISALVMDMLSFSKERAAELELDNMNAVIDDVVELMSVRATEHNVEINWNRNDLMPEFYFDRELINRAVLNLVTNAIDAAADEVAEILARIPDEEPIPDPPPKGIVDITLGWDESNRNVRICVSDNGAGIPEDKLEQVFTPFFSSKGAKGTGLGLPVVKKVVTEHGGTVTALPHPGGGTIFRIDLPFKLNLTNEIKAPSAETFK